VQQEGGRDGEGDTDGHADAHRPDTGVAYRDRQQHVGAGQRQHPDAEHHCGQRRRDAGAAGVRCRRGRADALGASGHGDDRDQHDRRDGQPQQPRHPPAGRPRLRCGVAEREHQPSRDHQRHLVPQVDRHHRQVDGDHGLPRPGPVQHPGQQRPGQQGQADRPDTQRHRRHRRRVHVALLQAGHPDHGGGVGQGIPLGQQHGCAQPEAGHRGRGRRADAPVGVEVAELVHEQPDDEHVEVADCREATGEDEQVAEHRHEQQRGGHGPAPAAVPAQRDRGECHHHQVDAQEPQRLQRQHSADSDAQPRGR